MGTVRSTHECAENFIQIWSAYFKRKIPCSRYGSYNIHTKHKIL